MTFAEVNPAVNMLLPGAAFTRLGSGLLYLATQPGDEKSQYRWRLRDDRLWPYDRRSAMFTGGTTVQALTQLSLWLLDYPRLGVGWWKYITGPNIWPESERGRGEKLVQYLDQSSYHNPAKSACVHCGNEKVRDWWACKGGPVGPYCGCKDTRKKAGAA